MNNEKLRQDCLAHWRRMLDLSVEDIREDKEAPKGENCAFCQTYAVDRNWGEMCLGCPIMEATGQPNCEDTPFHDASDVWWEIRYKDRRRLSEFRKAVKKEIRFLERLEINE